MGSGHNRSGRGNNRRPRNGPPPRGGRGPQHMNGQRNGQPAVTAISPRSHQGQPSVASIPAAYEAELDVVEVDEVEEVEIGGEDVVVQVHEVTASFQVTSNSHAQGDEAQTAAGAAVEDDPPTRSDRPLGPPAARGQRQPYVPAMSTGRQGPPPPQARPQTFVAAPAEARQIPSRPSETDDEGGAGSMPAQQGGARPRPERFAVVERPHREHGERYQHVPGTLDIRGEVGSLIDSLRTLFHDDRTVASQNGATRCGICYFHYPLSTLVYREDGGFYLCQRCEKALGGTPLHMVRRQQRH